ncbi:MAG: carboxymuconolactone decarboxylase family protein, partial [Burkholderiales bacterium]|nr:carboxymuconolactone decarboxylase family protein [Burkholderiales bacterium]
MAGIKSKAYLTLKERHRKFIDAVEALGQAAKQEG